MFFVSRVDEALHVNFQTVEPLDSLPKSSAGTTWNVAKKIGQYAKR